MKHSFINNSLFRLFVPPAFGIWSYMLILLIFDRIEQLTDNFFLFEVFLCILLSYLVSESTKYSIRLCNKLCNESTNHFKRIFIQSVLSLVLAGLITSLIITGYYKLLVGFNSFNQELLVFNLIFLMGAVLLQAAYFSIYFLNQSNTAKMALEEKTKQNTENELKSYKNKINLEFLTKSLETLIGLAHKDVKKADVFVGKLSEIYRSILSESKTELITLHDELSNAGNLIEILNHQFDDCLHLKVTSMKNNTQDMIVPGTMIVLLEKVINETIINKYQPLVIECLQQNNQLLIQYRKNNRLQSEIKDNTELNNIQKAYAYFSEELIEFNQNKEYLHITVPLFKMQTN